VPIIADDLVQMDKGTGAVMCCTFGDETDIKWWQKWDLEMRNIVKEDGTILPIWSASYMDGEPTTLQFKVGYPSSKTKISNLRVSGYSFLDASLFQEEYSKIACKKIKEARDEVIKNLSEKHLLIESTPITHSVKCAERSGAPIEILVVPQWFIKILDKKDELKNKANQCGWFPEYMKIRLEQWIEGLQWDWCISRQRFFGVKFPIWYSKRKGEEGRILIADYRKLPVDPLIDLPDGYSRDEVDAETDIMDTWATSSISPQLSSKGISKEIVFDESRHSKLFPADLRPQAHEIIRSWAFYTIVKSLLHQDSIPWKNLMISGWCLASDKTKMSKSKGNIITPTSLIKEKGSDVVRYWASASNLGSDIAYSEEVFKIGQKLITKLFNSAKFCSMNFHILKDDAEICEGFDYWILGKLYQTIENSKKEFLKFEYAKAREIIEEFFWHYFCDNYLEICKVRSYGLNAEKIANKNLNQEEERLIIKKQQSAIKTLQICLNAILKLFAPFIPHICEEIYSVVFEEEFINKKSIHSRGNIALIDKNIAIETDFIELGDRALEIIFEVRKWKSERNLSMKTNINNLTIFNNQEICQIEEDLANVCNALIIDYKNDENNNLIEIKN